ncbi:hypothetical protein E3N88_01524 [Mikania micrantha]|uniref:Uncharacterized protein n=1 Tax=Mikania micrantha TaxID=192012 RepID=A0A5N6Q3H8_9ASTR|nr:hypothetical protein E3N88_01524 [Mikania micrantha]
MVHHDSITTPLNNKVIVGFGIQERTPTKIDAHDLTATRDLWHINSNCLIFQVYTQDFKWLSAADRYGFEEMQSTMYHGLTEQFAPFPKGYGILMFPHVSLQSGLEYFGIVNDAAASERKMSISKWSTGLYFHVLINTMAGYMAFKHNTRLQHIQEYSELLALIGFDLII